MQPSTSTFWVSPIPPNSTVPTAPSTAKAGVAGAVVPTPAGCQPATKWCQVADPARGRARTGRSGAGRRRTGRGSRTRAPRPRPARPPAGTGGREQPAGGGAGRSGPARTGGRGRPARRSRRPRRRPGPTLPVSSGSSDRVGAGQPASRQGTRAVGDLEALVGEPGEVGRQPGAPPQLQPPDLGVGDRRRWARIRARARRSSPRWPRFQRQAPTTARARARSRATRATSDLARAPAAAAWGRTRSRWKKL